MGSLENIKIVFVGFETSVENKENILIVFKKLLEEVPYGAFVQVNLEKVATGFDGRIDVSSMAGEFMSTQSAMTPQDLVEKLYKDLRIQLMEWKSRRFSEVAEEINA